MASPPPTIRFFCFAHLRTLFPSPSEQRVDETAGATRVASTPSGADARHPTFIQEMPSMSGKQILAAATAMVALVLGGAALSAGDKYALQVQDGLAFSEFKGYESWPVVSLSLAGDVGAVIVANPVMME